MGSLFKGLNEPTLGFGLINISFKYFSLVDALFIFLSILLKVNIPAVPVPFYMFVLLPSSVSDPTWMPPNLKSQ